MNLDLWLNELADEGISSPWLISHNSTPDFSINSEDWVIFLENAANTLFCHHPSINTFYAWHDQQASQLRFNAISGPINELPFASRYTIVKSPIEFLINWLSMPDHIPWQDLTEVQITSDNSDHKVYVWAKTRTQI